MRTSPRWSCTVQLALLVCRCGVSGEEIPSIAAVSARGKIIAQRRSSAELMRDGETSHQRIVRQDTSHPEFLKRFATSEPRSRIGRLVSAHMKPHSVWSTVLLAKRYLQPRPVAIPAKILTANEEKPKSSHASDKSTTKDLGAALPKSSEESPNFSSWFRAILITLVGLCILSQQVSGRLKVELEHEDDTGSARGRPCWTTFCAVSSIILALITFTGTFQILTTNNEYQTMMPNHPGYVIDKKTNAVVRAGNAGERSYEAAVGVACSVTLMCLIILRRRHLDQVQVKCSLLSFFSMRGATVASAFSGVAELLGIVILHIITGMSAKSLIPEPEQFEYGLTAIGVASTMMMVAIVEELGKVIAVIWGVYYTADALRQATSWYPVLVENRRAFMLAGLCSGVGFMTVENMGYLISASQMRDTGEHEDVEKIVRWAIMFVRVALNIHPWLVGVTCARIARLTFEDGRDSPSLTLRELSWAMTPAVLAHAAFDFGLLAMGFLAIFMPIGFWFFLSREFDREWKEAAPTLDGAAAGVNDADPAEELAAATSSSPTQGAPETSEPGAVTAS